MRWWLSLAGIAALIVGFWPWSASPPATLPLPSATELSNLLERDHDAQVAWLTQWQEEASSRLAGMHDAQPLTSVGASVQALLVQGHPPVVVVNTLEEDTSSEGTLGWELPWPQVVDALKEIPAAPVELVAGYRGVTFSHTLIPVDPQAGLVLVATHAAPTQSHSIFWRVAMGIAAIACFLLAGKFGTSK